MEIYVILNKINYKAYFGQTKNTAVHRWKEHIRHSIKSPVLLACAIRKYGVDNFYITTIDICDSVEELNTKEIYYIKEYNTYGEAGYNMTNGGERNAGYIHSDETRRKISEAGKGRVFSEETKLKMSEAGKGRVFSEETKLKISEAGKGKKHSKTSKLKMSEASKGRVFSEEHKRNLSESRKGIIFSESHKLKMSEASKGRVFSEETKLKMSEASKGKGVSPVLQYDKDRNFIKIFSSIKEARELTKCTSISDACRKEIKTSGGFIWRYADDPL